MFPLTAERTSLQFALGPAPAGIVEPGVPVIAGETVDAVFGPAVLASRTGAVTLYRAGDWLLGVAVDPRPADLEQATHGLYREMMAATRGRHLARIWNFVPAINESGVAGLENYRAFCGGRSRAFEEEYGAAFKPFVPAASAVGCDSTTLTVV